MERKLWSENAEQNENVPENKKKQGKPKFKS